MQGKVNRFQPRAVDVLIKSRDHANPKHRIRGCGDLGNDGVLVLGPEDVVSLHNIHGFYSSPVLNSMV